MNEIVQSGVEIILEKINYQCNGLCKSVTKSVWMSILTMTIPLITCVGVWLILNLAN